MNQVLSYCTARPFSRGFIPLVALKPQEVDAHNDNRPEDLYTVLAERTSKGMPAAARRAAGGACARPEALNTPA